MLPAKQHINLQIGAHNVSLDIPREAEPLYRNAAVTLNERYQYYQRRMLKASAEQLWLYVALELAVNLHADAREKSLKPIHEKLEVLNQLIENCLQKENNEGIVK
ncbi:MAG: cell division protein ZapA [Paludibacteraceae bacterium]